MSYCDLFFRVFFKNAVDLEIWQVSTQRRIQIYQSFLNRQHDNRGSKGLGYGLDAERCIGSDVGASVPIGVAKAFRPQNLSAIYQGDGYARYFLLFYQVWDQGPVFFDHSRYRIIQAESSLSGPEGRLNRLRYRRHETQNQNKKD